MIDLNPKSIRVLSSVPRYVTKEIFLFVLIANMPEVTLSGSLLKEKIICDIWYICLFLDPIKK